MVKGLKEDKLETSISDKSGNVLETVDSIEQLNLDKPNHLEVKQTKGQWKTRQHRDNEGGDKGLMSRQVDREGRGARNRTDRDAKKSRSEEPEKQKEPQVCKLHMGRIG
mgnify:CR=1 FL=1